MRFALQTVLVLMLVGLFAACQKKDSAEPAFVREAEKSAGKAASTAGADGLPKEYNVGDAESGFTLNLELDPESQGAMVTEEKTMTSKKTLSISTVTVTDPNLQHLWVRVRIAPLERYTKRVVALRGALERDSQPIAGFQTVLGKYCLEKPTPGVNLPPKEFRVDVLAGLTERPKTMLVLAKTEVLLAPKGSDEAVVDPATLKADPAETSAKISNPLRINFAAAPAAAAPSPTPAPAPAQ